MFRIVLIIISLLVSQISGAKEFKTEQSGDYPELATKAKEHLKELEKTATIAQVHPFLMNIFVPQNQKFLKNWNSYSSTLEIAKLKTPVSIIQRRGSLTSWFRRYLDESCFKNG